MATAAKSHLPVAASFSIPFSAALNFVDCENSSRHYAVRSLIHELIQSDLFLKK